MSRISSLTIVSIALLLLAVGAENPATAQGTLFVQNDRVGIGTSSPERELHVFKSLNPSNLKVEGTGAGIILQSTAAPADERVTQIFVSSIGKFRMRGLTDSLGQTVSGITLDLATGNVGINETTPSGTLDVNGTIFLSGSQIHPDYVFESDYELETIEDHAIYMWRNKHLPAVGPAVHDEEGRSVIELGAKTMGMLEELEKAHVYIEQLHRTIQELKAAVSDKDESIATHEDRLARLEAALFLD